MRRGSINDTIGAVLDGYQPTREECADLVGELRRLRSEVRRLRGWLRVWRSRVKQYGFCDYAVVYPDDLDLALRGKQPPKVKR